MMRFQWRKREMSTSKLSKTQKLLAYGLNLHGVNVDDGVAMILFLEEEADQLLMIDYLMNHPNATPQEILNESGRLLIQRKKLQNSSQS